MKRNRLLARTLCLLTLIATIYPFGCKQRELKWGADKDDIRDLPAIVIRERKIKADSKVKVQILQPSSSNTIRAIQTGEADVSYVEAPACLKAMANKEVDVEILAVTSRDKSGKPDRLLVARRGWLNEFPKGAAIVLSTHRDAVRFLQDDRSEAIALVSKWTGTGSLLENEKILSETRWESGLDIADLIDLLDGLRRSGAITGADADNLAQQLLKKQPPEGQ